MRWPRTPAPVWWSPLKAYRADSSACARFRSPDSTLSPLASHSLRGRGPAGLAGAFRGGTWSMRPPSMSGHFLLAPIPESSSDYLLPRDIKLAVLGAGRVGKSGECLGDRMGRPLLRASWTAGGWGRAGARGRGGQDPGTKRTCPPARFPAASRSIHSRAVAALAPVGERGLVRQVEYLLCRRPSTKDHYDRLWVLQGPQLVPPSFSLRGSRFDGLIGVLQLILLFHFQQ